MLHYLDFLMLGELYIFGPGLARLYLVAEDSTGAGGELNPNTVARSMHFLMAVAQLILL